MCTVAYYIYLIKERTFNEDNVLDGGRELVAEYKRLDEKYQKFIREFGSGGFSMKYRWFDC